MIYHKLPRTPDTRGPIRIGVLLIFFLLIVGVIYGSFKYQSNMFSADTPTDNDVLLKVGKETIYYKDLSTELASYPDRSDGSAKGIVTQKLIDDSVILQGASDEGLVDLDVSVFNSIDKDYAKRISLIEDIKANLNKDSVSAKGYVVSIWYRNNGYIGPRGLAASKELARKKLEVVRQEVVSGRMSIQTAGNVIKNDSSLKELDLAYKNNAIFPFTLYRGSDKKVTLSSDLDESLASLSTGGVSTLYTGVAEDPQTGESYDAVYMFGQVTEKDSSTREYQTFDDWLQVKKQIYEVGM
jgi:hypothetical protein